MGTFWKLLSLELRSLDQNDFYEPDAELRPDDHVVGDLSEDLIRLYTMWRLLQKQTAEKTMEAKFGRLPDEQKEELIYKIFELNSKANSSMTYFGLRSMMNIIYGTRQVLVFERVERLSGLRGKDQQF